LESAFLEHAADKLHFEFYDDADAEASVASVASSYSDFDFDFEDSDDETSGDLQDLKPP
jgi:hypothetical protein